MKIIVKKRTDSFDNCWEDPFSSEQQVSELKELIYNFFKEKARDSSCYYNGMSASARATR